MLLPAAFSGLRSASTHTPGSPAVDFSFDFQDLVLRPVTGDASTTPR